MTEKGYNLQLSAETGIVANGKRRSLRMQHTAKTLFWPKLVVS